MTIYNNNGVQILKAADGMFLTQKDDTIDGRVFYREVTIVNGNDEFYRDATAKEKDDYELQTLNKMGI